jgi:xylose isomerase
MRTYLILRERAAAFRADPEVQDAMRAARVEQLAIPTLTEGESPADLRAEAFDADAAGKRSMAYGRLDQLAVEHILGARVG